MLLTHRVTVAVSLLLFCSVPMHRDGARADAIDPARCFPQTTAVFLAIEQPADLLAGVIDHPISVQIQNLEVYKTATQGQAYRNFLTGRKFFELQIGTDWRRAFETLTARGIYGGLDAETRGGILLVRGDTEETAENFRLKILELTRLNNAREPDEYRGVKIYRLPQGGAAVVRDWIITTNNAELGKSVLDRLLDSDSNEGSSLSLSDNPRFQDAKARRANAGIWGFADLKAVRDAGTASEFFTGQADNPLAELLFGGLQSVLNRADWLTTAVSVAPSGLSWNFAAPFDTSWIPEERIFYFGTDAAGRAAGLSEVDQALLQIATYRDVSLMWQRAGDLFSERMNDQLAEVDAGLSTIFAGRDFGEEILGAFAPEIGVTVCRQNFEHLNPAPSIRLPAFALTMTMREPDIMRSDLRRTFQSAVGFFNIVGAQNGQPQLEMDMKKTDKVEMTTSRYVPEKKDRDSRSAPIYYNFSPSVAFLDDRFVLSSTAELAEQLITAPAGEAGSANTIVTLNAGVLRDVLADNREHLISQNMLQEGNTRDEASSAISLLLEVIHYVRGAGLELLADRDVLHLRLSLEARSDSR